jgi:lariat debranching enzyme
VRNYQDLQCMAVPDKYKHLQNFYKCVRIWQVSYVLTVADYRYYTGERSAPLLTIVIGGNHEASNYMSEL